ncbi:hypothetical protein L6452_19438 [Arctium lappa]|uniref:Uncharacterized protein n=1 Tax=Arctium lappa TaxID=4217 RepID=A0ACB9B9U1_ARCLA|nr:hypothetical protein L6452_19438 [Arctium lappa]
MFPSLAKSPPPSEKWTVLTCSVGGVGGKAFDGFRWFHLLLLLYPPSLIHSRQILLLTFNLSFLSLTSQFLFPLLTCFLLLFLFLSS